MNLDDWLLAAPPADIYVLGYVKCCRFKAFLYFLY